MVVFVARRTSLEARLQRRAKSAKEGGASGALLLAVAVGQRFGGSDELTVTFERADGRANSRSALQASVGAIQWLCSFRRL